MSGCTSLLPGVVVRDGSVDLYPPTTKRDRCSERSRRNWGNREVSQRDSTRKERLKGGAGKEKEQGAGTGVENAREGSGEFRFRVPSLNGDIEKQT